MLANSNPLANEVEANKSSTFIFFYDIKTPMIFFHSSSAVGLNLQPRRGLKPFFVVSFDCCHVAMSL